MVRGYDELAPDEKPDYFCHPWNYEIKTDDTDSFSSDAVWAESPHTINEVGSTSDRLLHIVTAKSYLMRKPVTARKLLKREVAKSAMRRLICVMNSMCCLSEECMVCIYSLSIPDCRRRLSMLPNKDCDSI